MISIFNKELRDCLKWVPAGMLIALVMVWWCMPKDISGTYSPEHDLMAAIGWSAALIAVALGLAQSLFDIRNDARGYLLHRPVTRLSIFWGKLLAGLIAYVIALTPSVLLAAFYLGGKGLEVLPTSGLQVIPAVLLALTVFLLHPVALWIGNRDARWLGTRTLPICGILPVGYLVSHIYMNGFGGGSEFHRLLFAALVWLVNIVSLVIVVAAAKHAFCNQQMLPPASGTKSHSWTSTIGLVFSSIVLTTTAIVFLVQAIYMDQPTYKNRQLLMNAAGEFQQVEITRSTWDGNTIEFSVRSADSTTDFLPVDEDWKLAEYSLINAFWRPQYSWFNQFQSVGSFGSDAIAEGPVYLRKHRGLLLAYGFKRLAAIITPQGVSRDGQHPTGQFSGLGFLYSVHRSSIRSAQASTNPLMVDANGLHQFNTDTFEMKQLTSESANRGCLLLANENSPATFWTLRGNTLTQHEVSATDGETIIDEGLAKKNYEIALPLIKIDNSKKYEINLDSTDAGYSVSVFRGDDGRYGYVRYNYRTTRQYYGMLEEDGGVTEIGPIVVPSGNIRNDEALAIGVPPVLVVGASIYSALDTTAHPIFGAWALGLVHALCAAGLSFWITKFYDLPTRLRLIWTLLAALAGWGICLAVVACHRRMVKEACPQCQRETRVDLDTCTHCAQPWLPPELDQIEIFDSMAEAA